MFLSHPFLSKGTQRYIASHLHSNKVKITTLNLGVVLLISRTLLSLFNTGLNPKGGSHHDPNLPVFGNIQSYHSF